MNTNDVNQSNNNNETPSVPNMGMPVNDVPQTFDPTPVTGNQNPVPPMQGTDTIVSPAAPEVPTPAAPVAPTPMPAPAQAPTTPTPMPTDPNASIPVVNMANAMNNQVPNMQNQEVAVINTKKNTSSNIGLFIVILLLILFILNVDTIVKYYDNFIASGSLTSNNNSSDNLTNGFIQIGEQTSSKKEQGITFKNFKKQDGIVTFNYEALSSTKPKNIYIELYDASKNLLYTEIFSVTSVEKDSLAQYSVKVPSDVYDTVSYANVKTINATIPSTLTCKKSDDDYDYKNVYNFNSDSLASYEVTKVERSENANLQTEFDNLDKSLNATYQDKILKYSVDLETTTTKVLFQKGLSSYAIKNNQEAIDWKCE